MFYTIADLLDEENAAWGDPRRCPAHGCVTSSRDGLHDGLCGRCEAEMEPESEPETPVRWPEPTAPALDSDIPF